MNITPHQYAPPWKIDLEQLFTNMVLFQNPRDGNESKAKQITIEQIANPYNRKYRNENVYSRRVLIEGKLGHGKTSLMKYIAHLWATNSKKSPFTGYLVVYLELRQMNKNESNDFIHYIIHHAFPSDFVEKHNITVDMLRHYIINNDKKFVFLCDGYNELRRNTESQILNAFSGNSQRNSIVILTTRPENMDKLTKLCHSHIKIKGFTPDQTQEYITKFFKEEPEKANLLITKQTVKEYSHVFEIARTPLFMFYLCTFWKISETLPSTVIELYRELMICKVNQTVAKQGGGKNKSMKVRCFDEIGTEFCNAMLFIGKAILKALFENRFHLFEDDLSDKNMTSVCIKYGLISEETNQSELSYRTTYSTVHKSESEFLAAFYVAKAVRNGDNIKDQITVMLANTRMMQVCKFTVALMKEQAHLFLDYFPINNLDCSFLAELLEECPDNEVSIVIKSINLRMIYVEEIKISNPIGLCVCRKLSNFTQTRKLNLTTDFINFDGKDIASILQNMPLLKEINWQGVNDEYMKTFVILPPFPFTLQTIIMDGNIKHSDACRNLACFLYHCKSLTTLKLPVIAYGPGLYLFVSVLYGHEKCYQNVLEDSHFERAKYMHMEYIAFSLKHIYDHEHRIISYVFLVSRFVALCPFLKQIFIFKPYKLDFGEKLFIELTELCVFREYIAVHHSLPCSSDKIEGVLQIPTKNLEFMVKVCFSGSSGTKMKIDIGVEEIQSTSEIDCSCLQWLSVPFQKIPKSVFKQNSPHRNSVLHISWYKDLPFHTQPGKVGNFVSRLCNTAGVISLMLPCEALSSNIFSKEIKDMHVEKLKFSLNQLTANELCKKSYVKMIGDILPHFSTINTVALPPLQNAFTLPFVSNVELSVLNILRQLEILIPDPDTNQHACELLSNMIRGIPISWLNQMDFNGDGSLLFSLPTMRVYEEYAVRQPRDKRQTSIDVVRLCLAVNLYGFKPCHIQNLVDLLQSVDSGLQLRKVFIHPSIMFTNPYATKLVSAFKEIQIIKCNALAEYVHIDSKIQILNRIKGMYINEVSIDGWIEMSETEFVNAVKESQATNDPLADWISLISLLHELPSDIRLHVSCFSSKLKSMRTERGNIESLVKLLKNCSSLRVIRFTDFVISLKALQEMLMHCKMHNVVVPSLNSIEFVSLESIDSRTLHQLFDFFPSVSKMFFNNVVLNKTESCRTVLPANMVNPQVSTDSFTELVFSGDSEVNGSALAEIIFSSPHIRSIDASKGKFHESCFISLLCDVTDKKGYIHKNLETLSLGNFRVSDKKSAKVGMMYSQFLLQMPALAYIDISRFKMGTLFLEPFLDYFNHDTNFHVGLKHLDVSGHRLQSETMILFCDFLSRLPDLNVLSMAKCRIYSDTRQLLDFICHDKRQLHVLDFSGFCFRSEKFKMLFVLEILRRTTIVQKLYLRKSNWNFLADLSRELIGNNIGPQLRCLNLSHSHIADFVTIAKLVIGLRHLVVLNMENCNFTGHTLQKFTESVQKFGDNIVPELLEFDISSSDFSAPSSGVSVVSVLKTFSKLEILRLKSCNITDTVVDNMLINLEDLNVTNLRSVVICDNPLSRPLAYAISIGKYLPVSCKVKVTSVSIEPQDENNELKPVFIEKSGGTYNRCWVF
ncbi:uncharacterized protein LOC117102776 [Anneissia japonica]|uniref:uncharacterized protein LOC117102776 n=1 Tax=Anneissia japonica TaxID=1529436 RepID=UPI00142562AD|nr:uncharacterized protein LOC117102776 [Anneissia japonica]XP_033099076.1 uncharacterized protein LOC117102776 [Anneissia japonica]